MQALVLNGCVSSYTDTTEISAYLVEDLFYESLEHVEALHRDVQQLLTVAAKSTTRYIQQKDEIKLQTRQAALSMHLLRRNSNLCILQILVVESHFMMRHCAVPRT